MLFYRFISENLTAYLNEAERSAGNPDFDYSQLANADAEFGREETVKEKGFYIVPQDLFANVRERARNDENLNETLSRVFTNIEASAVGTDSEDDIKGLFAEILDAVEASPTLRNKRDLIVAFVESQSVSDGAGDDWRAFISERRDNELDELISEESLKVDETRTFVAEAFRDGAVPTSGTAITKILPPASRFSADNSHSVKKQRVLGELAEFFDRYFGLT